MNSGALSATPALALAAAFGLGSLPWALWVGRLARGVDVRHHGSGNLGATNVYRTLGPGLGWTVFILDALKGAGGVALASSIGGDAFPGGRALAGLTGALAAVLGHVFTPFAGFKGGKGAATSAGAMIAVAPIASALCLTFFGIATLISRRISVGTITAALALPLFLWCLKFTWAGRATAIVGSFVSLLILVRHLPNIRRLLAGTEPPFQFRRAPTKPAPTEPAPPDPRPAGPPGARP